MNEVSTRGRLTVTSGEVCDRGKVREENQDHVRSASIPLGELFIVADGIGGYQGGATASRMVVDGFHGQLAIKSVNYPPEQALQEACTYTNTSIHNAANAGDSSTQRMGSTVVLALLQLNGGTGPVAWIGHVGDSRAYLIRNGRMQKITNDHSAVQALLSRNLITEEEARNHPDASVLTRSLGHRPEVEIEIDQVPLQVGDALLLCSDGLWGYVGDADIAAVATDAALSVRTIADTLLSQALAAGGLDNIGIEYIRIEGASPGNGSTPFASRSGQSPSGSLAGSHGDDQHDHHSRRLRLAAIALILLGGLGGVGAALYIKYGHGFGGNTKGDPKIVITPVPNADKGNTADTGHDRKQKSAEQGNKRDERKDNPQPTPAPKPDTRRQVAIVGEVKNPNHVPPIPGTAEWNVVAFKRESKPDCGRLARETPQVFTKGHTPGMMAEIVKYVPGLKDNPGVVGAEPQPMTPEVSKACGEEFEVVVFLSSKGAKPAAVPPANAPPTDTVPTTTTDSQTDPQTNAVHPQTPKPHPQI